MADRIHEDTDIFYNDPLLILRLVLFFRENALDELVGLLHIQMLGQNRVQHLAAQFDVVHPEQRACMALSKAVFADLFALLLRQAEQAQLVRQGGLALPQPERRLFLRHAPFFDQAPDALGLFEDLQVLAL